MKKATITHANGRQVTTADPEKVKAAMKPATSRPAKQKTFPGMSENTQRVKDAVFAFAASGYPKILPYFTPANQYYRNCAKYLYPEDILHIAICALIREYYPALKVSHAKNEGKEGFAGQAKKKLMGVLPGFSDLMIQRPGITVTLFFEIKVKPNVLTADQKKFIEFQQECGHPATAVYSIVEANEALQFFYKNY